jgi:hypothetical protein
MSVSAAKGGKVEIAGAALDIPGGSLSGDVRITATTEKPTSDTPASDTLTGSIYAFGPSGTKFDPPATLTLPLDATPPDGKEAVVSWLDEQAGAWVDLDTTVAGGKVSAPIAHFTRFVVRFRDASAGPVDCSFTTCGGDISGDWLITAACVDDGKDAGKSSNPFGAACPDAVYDVSLDASGDASFGADGSFELTLTGSPAITVTVPSDCLSNGMFPFSDCTALGTALSDKNTVTCTGDKTAGCKCTGNAGDSIAQHKTGTYSVSGDQFTTTTEDDAGGVDQGDPADFCVTGSTLKVKTSDDGVIVLKRK